MAGTVHCPGVECDPTFFNPWRWSHADTQPPPWAVASRPSLSRCGAVKDFSPAKCTRKLGLRSKTKAWGRVWRGWGLGWGRPGGEDESTSSCFNGFHVIFRVNLLGALAWVWGLGGGVGPLLPVVSSLAGNGSPST